MNQALLEKLAALSLVDIEAEPNIQPDPNPNSPIPGQHLWGWLSPKEALWLFYTAAWNGSVVEIGCLHGRSSFALLSACQGPVYCIDPWSDAGYASFMASCGHFPNLHAIRASSPEAGSQVPGNVDMVFIDGDHHYGAVTADLEHWWPRTNKLICGHDYYDTTEEGVYWKVKSAVDDFFGAENVISIEETGLWYVGKKD